MLLSIICGVTFLLAFIVVAISFIICPEGTEDEDGFHVVESEKK